MRKIRRKRKEGEKEGKIKKKKRRKNSESLSSGKPLNVSPENAHVVLNN